MEKIRGLIDRLERERILTEEEFCSLIDGMDGEDREYLFARARRQAQAVYGNVIYAGCLWQGCLCAGAD